MQLFAYLLIYPLLWFFSILPFRIMYLFSDFMYLIIYYLIGYRKDTVRSNLALAFPEKSAEERLVIEKKSYRHLCDMFLEMNKTMTLSEKEMKRRFKFTNLELITELEKKNKSLAVMIAHYASYEWTVSMNSYISYKGFAIYKKLANPYFDKLVRDIRFRYKARLINTKESIPVILQNEKDHILGVYGFASDQSPRISKTNHFGTFMNIRTPVHTGAEMLAKRFNMNVIFISVKKVKRGFYEGTFKIISEDAKNAEKYEITQKFFELVEEEIRVAPEYYLWTHKRWKYRE